jgi:hypothetical protein
VLVGFGSQGERRKAVGDHVNLQDMDRQQRDRWGRENRTHYATCQKLMSAATPEPNKVTVANCLFCVTAFATTRSRR